MDIFREIIMNRFYKTYYAKCTSYEIRRKIFYVLDLVSLPIYYVVSVKTLTT